MRRTHRAPKHHPLPQSVDRFNNLFVTAYVTPGGARFLLLHDGKSDDACRAFFAEVHELYLRVRGPPTGHSTYRGAPYGNGRRPLQALPPSSCCM